MSLTFGLLFGGRVKSYTFIVVSHTSLSGMASQIGLTIHLLQNDTSEFASAKSFTVTSGTIQRVFIVRTNHPINEEDQPTGIFIVGTTNFAHGHVRIDPVATSPFTSTGSNSEAGDGFRDITMLSFWGAVIVERNTTGFAMEFIGDIHDSAAAPNFAGANPVSGPGAP